MAEFQGHRPIKHTDLFSTQIYKWQAQADNSVQTIVKSMSWAFVLISALEVVVIVAVLPSSVAVIADVCSGGAPCPASLKRCALSEKRPPLSLNRFCAPCVKVVSSAELQ